MDTKEYLKNVLELESLRLEQQLELEDIKEKADVDIDRVISKIPIPTKRQFNETAVEDTKSTYLGKGISYLLLSIFGLLAIVGSIVILVMARGNSAFEIIIIIICLIILAALDFLGFVKSSSYFSDYKYDETYETKLSRYKTHKQQCLAFYEQQYEEEMKMYEIQVSNLKRNLVQAKNLLQAKYEELQDIHNKTEETLEKLYDFDIIYPKYRDIVALSSINEYFDSGRCDSFTGPNGAYNMYENEVKQNLIISNLESICINLESIKNNQFTLYEIMSNNLKYYWAINNEISNTNSQVIELANTTKRLEDMQAINSGALAFIAMQQMK